MLDSTNKISNYKTTIFSKADKLVFLVSIIYLILDNSVLAPVIFGFPIGITGELILIPLMTFYIFTSKVKVNLILILILLWNFFTVISIIKSFPYYGLQSLRSATYCIDSNYIIIGSIIAQNNLKRSKFPNILWKVLFVANVYLLFLPFSSFLLNFTPKLTAFSGYSVPILFTYSNSSFLSSTFFFSENSFPLNGQKNIVKIISFLSLLFTFTYKAARYNYFVIFVLSIYSFLKKPKKIIRFSLYFLIGFILISLFLTLGIRFSSRGSGIESIGFFYDHFLSSFGISTSFNDGDSAGFFLRISWWINSFERLFSSIRNFIFGLGQGIPLTTFVNDNGIPVRDLHNSFIQIFIRDGLIGISIFSALHIKLISNVMHNIRITRYEKINNFYQTSFLFILAILINCLMQNTLEVAHRAIPYYFLFGLIGSYKLKFNDKN